MHTVDGDDVGHGEEGGQSSTELGEEVASLALFGLQTLLACNSEMIAKIHT
jgi:hypothetical protein